MTELTKADEAKAAEDFTFQDAKGRTWDCSLNMKKALIVDRQDKDNLTDLKFSLLSPDKPLFMEFMGNPSLVFFIIFLCNLDRCKKNMDIDPDESPEKFHEAELEFLSGIDGPTLTQAKEAFWGGLADFTQDHKTALLTFLQQMKKTEARVNLEIKNLLPEIDKLMEKQLTAEVGKMKKELTKLGGKSSK